MKPDKLITGKVYFMCGYENPGKPIPQIQTLVYLGKNLFKRDISEGDEYIFQDPQVYFIEDVTADDVKRHILDTSENSGRITVPQDSIDTVLSFDELLAWLETLRHAEGADQLY